MNTVEIEMGTDRSSQTTDHASMVKQFPEKVYKTDILVKTSVMLTRN